MNTGVKINFHVARGKAACALLISLALLSACGGWPPAVSSPTNTAGADRPPTGAVVSTPPAGFAQGGGQTILITPGAANTGDMKGLLAKSFQAQAGQSAFQALIAVTNESSGKVITSTLEYQAPDRLHWMAGDEETVVISHTTYLSQGGRGWQMVSADMSGSLPALAGTAQLSRQADLIKEAHSLGTASPGGTAMIVVGYTVEKGGLSSQSTIWIGTADNLPYRLEWKGVMNGGQVDILIIYQYPQSIDIHLP